MNPATITVTPLNSIANQLGQTIGSTRFRVNFPARTDVGVYSYAVGPDISDRIRSTTSSVSAGPTTTFDARALDPSQVDLAIPPGAPGVTSGTTTSNMVVSGIPAGQAVADVNVTIDIAHTFAPDLVITLISPAGTRVILTNQNGFGGPNYTNTTFDDQAAIPIGAGIEPFTGTFRPDEALSGFIGQAPNGTWQLEIDDVLLADVGTLLDWSLEIQTGVISISGRDGNPMDQDADAFTGEAQTDRFAAPQTASGIPFSAPFIRDSLPFNISGPYVVSHQRAGGDRVGQPGAEQHGQLDRCHV